MKKIISALLVMSMILTATVAFAAEPVASSHNPKIVLTAAKIVERNGNKYANITANIVLPDNTLSAIEDDGFGGYIGTGITSLTLKVKFDENMFDMSQSTMTKKAGEAGYNANDNSMNGGFAGTGTGAYAGTLSGFYSYNMLLKEGYTDITVDELNSMVLGNVTYGLLKIATYNETTDPVYETRYCTNINESGTHFVLATQVGAAAPAEPAAPVVGASPDVDAENKAKTWTVNIAADYVAAGDTLTATLYDKNDTSDKQDVTLSMGNNVVTGGAAWSFTLKATFENATKMNDIDLVVSK